MSEVVAARIVTIAGIYLGFGALFGLAFVVAGAARIDPAARGATWGFRLVILPGCIALWPWLLARLLSGATHPRAERNAHRAAAADGPAA